jgi:hypothetical protein
MSDNDAKLWVQRDVQAVARTAAQEAIQSRGFVLPCQVTAVNPNNPATGAPLGYSFVQVQFEVTVPFTQPDGTQSTFTLPPQILPISQSQWLRVPVQIGDFGIAVRADTFLGGITGLGAGVANLGTNYGDQLVFQPIGTTQFPAAPDPNKAWLNGPAGAVVSDAAQTAVITVAANLITLNAPSGTIQLQGAGTVSGDAMIRASDLQTALNAFATAIQTWATTHFTAGTVGAGWTGSAPIAPTAAGSTKAFTG